MMGFLLVVVNNLEGLSAWGPEQGPGRLLAGRV